MKRESKNHVKTAGLAANITDQKPIRRQEAPPVQKSLHHHLHSAVSHSVNEPLTMVTAVCVTTATKILPFVSSSSFHQLHLGGGGILLLHLLLNIHEEEPLPAS